GKRAGGEDFRREVRAHCLITRGTARSLAVPRELNFGDQFCGSSAELKLDVRVHNGGSGKLSSRSVPPPAGSTLTDMSRALSINAPAAIHDHCEIPVQLDIPADQRAGD